MPRCKNPECREKFTAKYFLQKYCSKECEKECSDGPKAINRKSEKRADQEEVYKALKKAYMLKEPFCERCARNATEIHHKNGRNGDRLNDINFFMSICRDCHKWVHNHPKEARENGYLI